MLTKKYNNNKKKIKGNNNILAMKDKKFFAPFSKQVARSN